MTGLVYSYLRFSDQRQAAGSSVARQIQYAERWAAAHGMKLDTSLSMSDHGLSAFHQRHVTEGALGVFLEAIKAGRVQEGSILIVEQLDRLSRADVLTAFNQLSSIVTAGVRVITTKDDMEFSREKLAEHPFILYPAITSMILAHEESANKSRRVTEAIVLLCKGWVAKHYRGKIRQGKDPQVSGRALRSKHLQEAGGCQDEPSGAPAVGDALLQDGEKPEPGWHKTGIGRRSGL